MGALARISLILLLSFMMAKSGLVPSPCAEMTYGVSAGQIYNVNPSCTQGSILWSYPNGTLTLSFAPTDLKDKFSVCFQSYSNESTFDVLDVTKRDKQPCKRISDTEVCTGYYINGILVDVEPKEPMRFLDEIRYRAVTTVQKQHRRNRIRS